jgi:cysteine desulfurase
MDAIYLDYNATTPLLPEAREAMQPWLDGAYGNASSTHRLGQKARSAVENSRERLAALLNCRPQEVFFTSGGTESDNLALLGAVRGSSRGRHVVAGAVEHHAVLNAVHALPSLGFPASLAACDALGRVGLTSVEAVCRQDTVLVSLMHANNETGVLQPIEEVGRWCRDRKVLFHTDAVQTFGKLPLNLSALPVDLLSASAHKFGGPQGVGFLYAREGLRLVPLMQGGEQESGLRPGTENVAGICGMAAAAEAVCRTMAAEGTRLAGLRDRLESGLKSAIKGLRVNGEGAERIPNTLSVLCPGVESDVAIIKLDSLGIQVSAGSACAAGAVQPSHVLTAMGKSEMESRTVLRFSVGKGTTEEQVKRVLGLIPQALEEVLSAA